MIKRIQKNKGLKKESSGIVRRAVDEGGIKTLWDEAFSLALDDLRDKYSIEEERDAFYVTLHGRFGDELLYQGYVALEGVEKETLVLHVVYPDSVSVIEQAKIFAGVDNVAPIESVGIDGITSASKREAVMDEIDEIIQGFRGAITELRDYSYQDMDRDIAEYMSESSRVEVIEVMLPSDDEVDYDPEYHDDEREAVLLAARDAIEYEIESYIRYCSSDADKVISDAQNEVDELEEELRDKLAEAEQLMSEISDMEIDEQYETRKRVRCNRK